MPILTLDITCAQTRTHHETLSYSTSRSASITRTHTGSCILEICFMILHRYTHPCSCPLLIACTNTYFSFTFTRAFPLHACGVTRNWRTYFISVRRLLNKDGLIVDCSMRHPSVERSISCTIRNLMHLFCKVSPNTLLRCVTLATSVICNGSDFAICCSISNAILSLQKYILLTLICSIYVRDVLQCCIYVRDMLQYCIYAYILCTC